ncbi:MAG: hypothetical protein HY615_17740, partial [Candidatus Rokubacteria bacterium]|nr:hypothetical protein [Candidatus Rokubacteria bacterium]
MLSALLPGLGQIYDGRWTRGILMLAIPFFFLSLLAFAVLFGGPLASAVIQRAALFALIVVGALFGYHLAIVGDAFAGGMRSPRGRLTIDYAILAAIVLGLVVAY